MLRRAPEFCRRSENISCEVSDIEDPEDEVLPYKIVEKETVKNGKKVIEKVVLQIKGVECSQFDDVLCEKGAEKIISRKK